MDFDAPPVIIPADFATVRHAKSSRSNPPGEGLWERRRRQRDVVHTRCEVQIDGGSQFASMIDLSSDGIGLWSSKDIAVGELVQVSIPLGRFRSIELPATVANCRPAGADAWRLGLHFFRRLTGEELAAALS